MRMSDAVLGVDVSRCSDSEGSPSIAPNRGGGALAATPESTRPQRSMRRRPRPDFIRDVRRLIEASWLAKVGQRWRWTPLQREYLYQAALRVPAWEIMALWDCYLERPWQECSVSHFCQPKVLDWMRDNPRFKPLFEMYRDRLISKARRFTREMLT